MLISPAGLVTAQYWRVWMDSPQSGSVIGIAALEMRTAAGGPNLALTPASATCSAGGSNPGYAFDGLDSTAFTCTGGQGWLQYNLGALTTITEIRVTARNDASFAQAPKNIGVYALDQLNRWVDIDVIGGTDLDAVGMTWSQGATQTLTLMADWDDRQVFIWRSSQFITTK